MSRRARMVVPGYDSLLQAARIFLAELREADQKQFDHAYQAIANEANTSEYGQRLEPRQGLCVAMQAEMQRRAFHESDGDEP